MAILEVGNGKQFAAISQASAVAKPNDEIVIHAGTYRETIKPTQDGITYRAAGDGAVVVTGGTASGGQWGTNGAFIEDRKNIVIKGIQFKNLNQNLSGDPWGTGVAIIRGSGNRIEDCTIDNAKGYGISMYGSYSTVRNCTVTNAYWNAVDMRGDHDTLEYNTLSGSGQHLIFARGKSDIIRYNYLSDACRWEQDGGAIYTHSTDGGGTQISYNRINGGYNQPFIYQNPAYAKMFGGIMLDDGSKNYIVDHNVIWNSQVGIKVGANGSPSVGNRIYNNTIWGSSNSAFSTYGGSGLSDIKVYNNLTDNNAGGWVGTDVKNNLATINPGFVDAANGNFQLQSNSPAIDKGIVISGLTDGYTGAAPEIGAYEFGQSWSAGAGSSTAPAAAPPAAAPTSSNYHIEGESIDQITGFRVENIAAASGGQALSLKGSSTTNGSATFIFQGQTGYYELDLGSFDENDGKASFDVDVNGNSIGSIVLDQQLPSVSPDATTKVTRQVASKVYLGTGDQITINGFADGDEWARIDFVDLIPAPGN